MNAKTNYALVGVFVLVSIGLIFVFVTWLLQPSDKKELQIYRINFTESVAGLNIDSPVKYRGVTIGKVKKIRINPDNVEEIEVQIEVDAESPIKTDTVAKLKPQGITGLTYVDLSQGSDETERLCTADRSKMPLIQSVPSFFVRIEQTFGSTSENISSTMHRVRELLSAQNREDVSRILSHTASILEKVDHTLDENTTRNFQRMSASAASLVAHIDAMTPQMQQLIENGDRMSVNIAEAMGPIKDDLAKFGEAMRVFNERNQNGDYSVKEYIGPGMRKFEMTMIEMERALILLNQLMLRYENSPSDILFEHQKPMIGPGEK